VVRRAYRGLLKLALNNRGKVIAGFLGCSLCSLALAPILGQNFFPEVDSGQIKLHIRAPTGTRFEETTRLVDGIGVAIGRIIPANELGGIVDNMA
jgi:multidrug efflux pump subunit AcrB